MGQKKQGPHQKGREDEEENRGGKGTRTPSAKRSRGKAIIKLKCTVQLA
jgi:hypothetical protein